MKNLGPISLGHRPLVEELLAKYPPEISEHSFTNLFIWRATRPIQLLEDDGSLLFVEPCENGSVLLGPPVGPLPLSDAIRAAESALGMPLLAAERLSGRVTEEARTEGFDVREARDDFDYVYRRSALAELAGRDYHGKRNLIAQCLAEHDCVYEEITEANLGDVRAMMERWCAARGCGREPGLCAEFLAIRELFDHYGELGAIGAALRVDGEIEAFTAGERLDDATAVVHFEKASAGVKGLYQLTNQWFCKNHLASFEWINREQDLGIEGLRKAKESYFPDHFVKKFKLSPHGTERAIRRTIPPPERCADAAS